MEAPRDAILLRVFVGESDRAAGARFLAPSSTPLIRRSWPARPSFKARSLTATAIA